MGGNQRNLTNSDRYDESPSWSPNGKRIAFAGNRKIYVMDADGGNLQRLTEDRTNGQDPHGLLTANTLSSCLIGRGTWEIFVMDADGGNPRNLTNSDRFVTREPSWSP